LFEESKGMVKRVSPERSKAAKTASAKAAGDRVTVENVNHPGKTSTVDGARYREARAALLAALPKSGGLTQAEMIAGVRRRLSGDLAAKAGWWTKCVQLDLEAKRVVVREGSKPIRWRLA
jgi:hypothetical protein